MQQDEQVDDRGVLFDEGTDKQVPCATVSDDDVEDDTSKKQTKTKQSRGADKRKKYDFIFKMRAIDLLDQGIL